MDTSGPAFTAHVVGQGVSGGAVPAADCPPMQSRTISEVKVGIKESVGFMCSESVCSKCLNSLFINGGFDMAKYQCCSHQDYGDASR